jgi:hypothetical protein
MEALKTDEEKLLERIDALTGYLVCSMSGRSPSQVLKAKLDKTEAWERQIRAKHTRRKT